MNVHFENVNLSSTSGPNHFASKILRYLQSLDVTFQQDRFPDARLCFIESYRGNFDEVPLVQRLDGIYFNSSQDYLLQNTNIQRTYNNANGVVFQSDFNRKLITKYFGGHKSYRVIHNGADVEYISQVEPIQGDILDKYDTLWCCAASWRPHKRLNENIRYFLEHAGEKDCLIVAGQITEDPIINDRVYYVGNIGVHDLTSIYKRSKYFLHLAWLDHCPNVVVDARAAGCTVICTSAGGTKEIAGPDSIIIEEEEWDFNPVELYKPPVLNFENKVNNVWNKLDDVGMHGVAKKYKKFLTEIVSQ